MNLVGGYGLVQTLTGCSLVKARADFERAQLDPRWIVYAKLPNKKGVVHGLKKAEPCILGGFVDAATQRILKRPRQEETNLADLHTEVAELRTKVARLESLVSSQPLPAVDTRTTGVSPVILKALWADRPWSSPCEICHAGHTDPVHIHMVFQTLYGCAFKLYASSNVRLACKTCAEQAVQHKSVRADLKRAHVWLLWMGPRYRAKCYCCKRQELCFLDAWHSGHVVSVAQGGVTETHNMRPICQSCNLSMGTKNMAQFMTRLGTRATKSVISHKAVYRLLKSK
jgi:hypothetical protein